MSKNILAFLWGLAEATLFFIVPDVGLTYMGKTDLKKGLIASLYCLLGALLGGVIMYHWGARHFAEAAKFMTRVPAINEQMLLTVRQQLLDQGGLSLFVGPLQGIPYKIYAIMAPQAEIPCLRFLLVSIPARWLRFVIVTTSFHYLLRGMRHINVKVDSNVIITVIWFLFYAYYFASNLS